jgi:hypothetical protein
MDTEETTMKQRLIVPMLGVAALVGATTAFAHGYHHRPTFQELDKDGNGVLTLDEVTGACQARAAERFNKLDANKDGQVTQQEIDQARQAQRERRKQEVPF